MSVPPSNRTSWGIAQVPPAVEGYNVAVSVLFERCKLLLPFGVHPPHVVLELGTATLA